MHQQLDHVSHVCFIYDVERLEWARQEFSDAFGIDDWDGPVDLAAFGVLQTQSVSAGIEILAPLTDTGPFREYLDTHGEGFFALIYGVRDLNAAVRSAQERGARPALDAEGRPLLIDALTIDNGAPAYPSWRESLRTYRETPFEPVAGVNVYLGEIEPLA